MEEEEDGDSLAFWTDNPITRLVRALLCRWEIIEKWTLLALISQMKTISFRIQWIIQSVEGQANALNQRNALSLWHSRSISISISICIYRCAYHILSVRINWSAHWLSIYQNVQRISADWFTSWLMKNESRETKLTQTIHKKKRAECIIALSYHFVVWTTGGGETGRWGAVSSIRRISIEISSHLMIVLSQSRWDKSQRLTKPERQDDSRAIAWKQKKTSRHGIADAYMHTIYSIYIIQNIKSILFIWFMSKFNYNIIIFIIFAFYTCFFFSIVVFVDSLPPPVSFLPFGGFKRLSDGFDFHLIRWLLLLLFCSFILVVGFCYSIFHARIVLKRRE